MYRFTLGMLTLLFAGAGTWSLFDKHLVTALIEFSVAVFFYNKLERNVFQDK